MSALSNLVKSTAAKTQQAAELSKLAAAAASYRTHCADLRKQLLVKIQLRQITTWEQLGIKEIPLPTLAKPFNLLNATAFLELWVFSSGERFKRQEEERKAQLAGKSIQFVKAEVTTGVRQVGRFTLRPRQIKCVDAVVETVFVKKTSQAAMIPIGGGEGKSVIAGAIIKYVQDNNYFGHIAAKMPLNRVIFLTDGTVSVDIGPRLTECGVSGVGRYVLSVPHTQLSSAAWAPYFVEETREHFGQKQVIYRYIMPPPAILIIDEFDRYKKPGSLKSKYLRALIEACVKAGSLVLFTCATPAVCLNDLWAFAVATGKKFNNEPITADNYGTVAKTIAARAGVGPADDSDKAIDEFRKEFADCWIVPPKDKQKAKATNRILELEFENDRDRNFYKETEERYLEELERCGEGDIAINPMSLLTKYRAAVEWIKAPYFAREYAKAHAQGFAPAIGVAYHATLCQITRLLVNEHKFPRNSFSVIHGGIELITQEKLIKLIGQEQFDKMSQLVVRFYRDRKSLTPDEATAVRKYLKWIKERAKFGETKDEQRLRQDELLRLRLGPQDLISRHAEKENYLRGRTTGMLFTLAAGGRGIDMDQQFPEVLPRKGFFTPIYYAEEFLQAFYRLCRLPTLTDVDQYVLAFKKTIEMDHVIPRLFRKIKAVQRGIRFKDDLADDFIEAVRHRGTAGVVAELPLDSVEPVTIDDVGTESLIDIEPTLAEEAK